MYLSVPGNNPNQNWGGAMAAAVNPPTLRLPVFPPLLCLLLLGLATFATQAFESLKLCGGPCTSKDLTTFQGIHGRLGGFDEVFSLLAGK